MNRLETAKAGLAKLWQRLTPFASTLPGERGSRLASDEALERTYRTMWIDYERRAQVALMREMDQKDGRVKSVHNKVARDTIRGGLVLEVGERSSSETLKREWAGFHARLQLNKAEKLKSDARGLVMEGNLPLQLVLDDGAAGAGTQRTVVAALRMPSDTIVPLVDAGGRFRNAAAAYEQRDVMSGEVLASFAAWQLMLGRLDPQNFDDMGSMGRPWLDASASTWRKLVMTEEDLVIRRRMRAPLRMVHVLEGADDPTLQAYRKSVEGEKGEISTDFYMNRKGGVTSIQGDENLGDIGDVAHLLDTFFAGSPAPRGLFGFTNGMARDILDDLKRAYYDEVDGLQDTLASEYIMAFRVHLLFRGIDPGPDEFLIRFAERRTETPNQVADLVLKLMAANIPQEELDRVLGYDPDTLATMRKDAAKRVDPYPVPGGIGGKPVTPPRVSVTPGNAPKGESATAVSQPGSNGGKGRG
jgi:hypothetical protein